MMSTNQKCVICLENKKVYVSCPHCQEGNYCKNCIIKLVNEDKYEACSICRRKDWYKDDKNIENLLNKKSEQDKMNKLSDMLEKKSCIKFHLGLCLVLFLLLTTALGYYITFTLLKVEKSFSENNTHNDLIMIILSFLTGLIIHFIIGFIILINKLILGDDWYKCCCSPSIMLPIILLLLLGTYLGSLIIKGTGVTLNVDEKYKDIVKYVLSFLIGNGIYLSPVILISLCNKCICKRRTETQNITGEELL